MAKYRKYKNGIFGHRYKGYYIIRGEVKGQFAIWKQDKSVFKDNIYDYEECEWIIDKETADHPTMVMLKMLYEKEIYELSHIMVELIQKRNSNGILDEKEEKLFDWVYKVRRRKVAEREF